MIPSEHFNAVLYTGNSSTQSITGVGFQPDFTWIKVRNNNYSHALVDSVRGVTKSLSSGVTLDEITWSGNGLTSFDSDGYSAGGHNMFNGSGTYVSWNWKCATSFSGTTAQGFGYTGRSNADAGISIVTVKDNYDAGTQELPHNLTKAPEIMFRKNINESVNNWDTGVKGFEGQAVRINTTDAMFSGGWYQSAATSSVIKINDGQNTGDSTGLGFIFYCFHSVDGYSKVGSYTGNGSSDGTFVYTGFRPAYVLFTNSTDSGQGWGIWDSERSTYNAYNPTLYPHNTGAEDTPSDKVDFTSNGFKLRNADSSMGNKSGDTYIYLAFAEIPFKNTTAR